MGGLSVAWDPDPEPRSFLENQAFGILLNLVYYTGFEGLLGRTPGKLLTGTRVVASSGAQPSATQNPRAQPRAHGALRALLVPRGPGPPGGVARRVVEDAGGASPGLTPQTRAITSPWSRAKNASGCSAQRRKARAIAPSSSRAREAVGDRLLSEGGELAAIRPEVAPPRAGRRVGEGPGGARRAHPREAGREGPALEEAPGVGLGAVLARHGAVELEPAREQRIERRPGEAGVVAVAHRDQAARPGDAAHLAQRGHRVREVLEHLMGVHHVEGGVREAQAIDVPGLESRPGRRRSPRAASPGRGHPRRGRWRSCSRAPRGGRGRPSACPGRSRRRAAPGRAAAAPTSRPRSSPRCARCGCAARIRGGRGCRRRGSCGDSLEAAAAPPATLTAASTTHTPRGARRASSYLTQMRKRRLKLGSGEPESMAKVPLGFTRRLVTDASQPPAPAVGA